MDAVEFLKERTRMCNAQDRCGTCPINIACEDYFVNSKYTRENTDGMVAAVEQWTKDHPVKTRQSEFLKMFPNASLDGGVINISPCVVDNSIWEECDKHVRYEECSDCSQNYWLQEVE